jgi:hypothetical protein
MEQWKGVMPQTTGRRGGDGPKLARRGAAEKFCKHLGFVDAREYRLPTDMELTPAPVPTRTSSVTRAYG